LLPPSPWWKKSSVSFTRLWSTVNSRLRIRATQIWILIPFSLPNGQRCNWEPLLPDSFWKKPWLLLFFFPPRGFRPAPLRMSLKSEMVDESKTSTRPGSTSPPISSQFPTRLFFNTHTAGNITWQTCSNPVSDSHPKECFWPATV